MKSHNTKYWNSQGTTVHNYFFFFDFCGFEDAGGEDATARSPPASDLGLSQGSGFRLYMAHGGSVS